jgi:hypothetical protein
MNSTHKSNLLAVGFINLFSRFSEISPKIALANGDFCALYVFHLLTAETKIPPKGRPFIAAKLKISCKRPGWAGQSPDRARRAARSGDWPQREAKNAYNIFLAEKGV